MLVEEAQWIAAVLRDLPDEEIGLLLNLGSSTQTFRAHKQPHVDRFIFGPLSNRGVSVIHSDIKDDEGVDVVADILVEGDHARLREMKPQTILCSNLLEHVPAPEEMANRIAGLVPARGRLILTAPCSYPYHPDPIDNGFRPTVDDVQSMFPELKIVHHATVVGHTLADELAANPKQIFRRIARSLVPLPGFDRWRSSIDRWRWLYRSYTATCFLMARPN